MFSQFITKIKQSNITISDVTGPKFQISIQQTGVMVSVNAPISFTIFCNAGVLNERGAWQFSLIRLKIGSAYTVVSAISQSYRDSKI